MCGYEIEVSERKGITVYMDMKWKRVNIRVSQHV